MATGTVEPRALPPPPPAHVQSVERERLIRRQLARTSWHVRLVDMTSALVVWAIGLLLLFLAAAVIDHWIGLGTVGRCLALTAVTGFTLWYLALHVGPLLVRAINPAYAARTIEEATPTLKNSLINFLMLRQDRSGLKEIVYQAVEQQAATDIAAVPVEAAVDRSRLIHAGYALCAAMTIFAAYKILSPKDPFQTIARVLAPWAEIVRPSRVQISEVEPGSTEVYYGQTVHITATVRGVRDNDKVSVRYSTADGQTIDQPIEMKLAAGNRYECDLPPEQGQFAASTGLLQNATYRVVAGDAETFPYRLSVVAAPTIIVDRLDYQFPAYTRKVAESIRQQGDIKALEGTKVTIHAIANQPIKSAWIEFDPTSGGTTAETVPLATDGQSAGGTITLQLRADRQTPWRATYQVRFYNERSQRSQQPILHRIEVLRDLAPEVQILKPESLRVSVPENGEQTIEVRAVDPDFGLSKLSLEGVALGKSPLNLNLLADGANQPPQITVPYSFRPREHNLVAGDELKFSAVAQDNRTSPLTGEPEPNTTRTKEYTLVVTAAQNQSPSAGGQANKQPQGNSAVKTDEQKSKQSSPKESPKNDEPRQPDKKDSQPKDGDSGSKQQPDKTQNQGEKGKSDPQQSQKSNSQKQQPQSNNYQDSQQKSESQQNNQEPRNQETANQQPQDQQQKSQSGDQQQSGQGSGGQQNDGQSGGKQQGQKGGQSGSKPESNDAGGDEQKGESIGQGSKGGRPSGNSRQNGDQRGEQSGDVGGEPSDNQSGGKARHDGQAIERIWKQMQQRGQGNQQPGQDSQQKDQNPPRQDSPNDQQPTAQDNSQPGGQSQSAGSSQAKGQNVPNPGTPEGNDQRLDPSGKSSQSQGKADKTGDRLDDQKHGQNPSEQQSGGNKGGQSHGANKSDKGEKSSATKAENRDPGAGKSSDEGAGQATNDKSGSGDGAFKNLDHKKELKPDNEKPGENEPSPANSTHRQNDSKGGTSGDNSGGGKQGAGQPGAQQGNDSAGSKSVGDQGAGKAQETGSGEIGSKAGQQQPASGKTGQSGIEKGQGSASRGSEGSNPPGANADQSTPGNQPGNSPAISKSNNQPSSGKASGQRPVGGSNDNSETQQDKSRATEDQDADAANLEYARKATEMVLRRLKDEEHNPDPELLDKLGWTREDLAEFLRRWESLEKSANESKTGKRELDEALKSLGLRDPANRRRAGGKTSDNDRNLRDAGNRTAAPPKYRELFDAFRKGAARSAP